jgi:hypothetical protein
MKNKIFVPVFVIFLLLFSCLFLTSCLDYVDYLVNLKWTSSEMEFILFHQTEGVGTIVYKKQKLEFYIGFFFDIQFYLVLKPDKYSPMAGELLNYHDVAGSMEFNKKEKKLILKFRSSDVFGDAFSTITLTSVEFDPLEIDPKERHYVSWISDVPDIRFYIRRGETK